MKIAIAGGSGFIGKHLTHYFLNKGHDVFILTRTEKTSSEKRLHYVNWLSNSATPIALLEGIDVVINLAGKSISNRWTEKAKKEIISSRIRATKEIYSIINGLQKKPSVFINASAVGFYGTSIDQTFTEDSLEAGKDFLARTVDAWEKEAAKIAELHVRTVIIRIGIVLGNEGALPSIVLPYKLFAGGKLGTGQQWVSWIHVKDLVALIDHTIHTTDISGPINATAPSPVNMNQFGKTIGEILHRPHWLPTPSFALKALLGEMNIMVLEGQKVIPMKALQHQFHFVYPTLAEALTDILKTANEK
jgi:uncharacterized protein (TIGR01777 family)